MHLSKENFEKAIFSLKSYTGHDVRVLLQSPIVDWWKGATIVVDQVEVSITLKQAIDIFENYVFKEIKDASYHTFCEVLWKYSPFIANYYTESEDEKSALEKFLIILRTNSTKLVKEVWTHSEYLYAAIKKLDESEASSLLEKMIQLGYYNNYFVKHFVTCFPHINALRAIKNSPSANLRFKCLQKTANNTIAFLETLANETSTFLNELDKLTLEEAKALLHRKNILVKWWKNPPTYLIFKNDYLPFFLKVGKLLPSLLDTLWVDNLSIREFYITIESKQPYAVDDLIFFLENNCSTIFRDIWSNSLHLQQTIPSLSTEQAYSLLNNVINHKNLFSLSFVIKFIQHYSHLTALAYYQIENKMLLRELRLLKIINHRLNQLNQLNQLNAPFSSYEITKSDFHSELNQMILRFGTKNYKKASITMLSHPLGNWWRGEAILVNSQKRTITQDEALYIFNLSLHPKNRRGPTEGWLPGYAEFLWENSVLINNLYIYGHAEQNPSLSPLLFKELFHYFLNTLNLTSLFIAADIWNKSPHLKKIITESTHEEALHLLHLLLKRNYYEINLIFSIIDIFPDREAIKLSFKECMPYMKASNKGKNIEDALTKRLLALEKEVFLKALPSLSNEVAESFFKNYRELFLWWKSPMLLEKSSTSILDDYLDFFFKIMAIHPNFSEILWSTNSLLRSSILKQCEATLNYTKWFKLFLNKNCVSMLEELWFTFPSHKNIISTYTQDEASLILNKILALFKTHKTISFKFIKDFILNFSHYPALINVTQNLESAYTPFLDLLKHRLYILGAENFTASPNTAFPQMLFGPRQDNSQETISLHSHLRTDHSASDPDLQDWLRFLNNDNKSHNQPLL